MKERVQRINAQFARIKRKLEARSRNYAVHFELFYGPQMAGTSLPEVLKTIVRPEAKLRNVDAATTSDVLEHIQAALRYRGDKGSRPSWKYLDSAESDRDFEELLREMRACLDACEFVAAFSLSEGHPVYPVFWDIAFWLEIDRDSLVLIASSSD